MNESYKGLPCLAGLCSMRRAIDSDWSLDESVNRLKRLHYVLKRVHETLTAKITAEPIYELKTAFSHHAYICAEQVSLIRRRVSEMREPPLELDRVPHLGLQRLLDEVCCAPDTQSLLMGIYEVVLPEVVDSCKQLKRDAHPLADAPTVRVAKLIEFELADIVEFGRQAIRCITPNPTTEACHDWTDYLHSCITAAGRLDGTSEESCEVPDPRFSQTPFVYQSEPKRDERFRDSYNAGVNPEAFLYDEQFSATDKTLMMYYKRLRELDVPEMMASILVELQDEEPWDFHMDMSRQLWDEARHAMMGEVGFASIGVDWTEIPINFTWSRNLNLQLNARERHGVLFYIEQTLMPRNGKRFELEVATASGDPLSTVFQDFDWADEVLHAQIGQRWFVPRFDSLTQALKFGDTCWSRVMSHWQEDLERGLTQHENWWPRVYKQACIVWGKEPDPAAIAFHETYENKRADLKEL